MLDTTDIEKMFADLLAQSRRSFGLDLADIQSLAAGGDIGAALRALCKIASDQGKPISLQSRALMFKIADRLGIAPETLGMLE